MSQVTRRTFLRLGLLGGIFAGAGFIYEQTQAVGFDKWFRWMMRGQVARLNAPSRVALAARDSYDGDLVSAVRQIWRDSGAPELRSARVVIKPNLVDYVPGRPCFTDSRVVAALIRFLRDEQAVGSVAVAEGTTFRRDSSAILRDTGYAEMLEHEKVEFVDLNYDDLVVMPLRGGYARMDKLFVARTITEADALISVPKLKTHHWTTLSASIKNLFGIVPGVKYGWPKNTLHIKGIPAFLAELLDSLPNPRRVALVDGIVGLQGDGPIFGTPINAGVLAAGTDFLAVDATCARLMGIDPAAVDYLNFSAWAGLGQLDASRIELLGARLPDLVRHFQRAPGVSQ